MRCDARVVLKVNDSKICKLKWGVKEVQILVENFLHFGACCFLLDLNKLQICSFLKTQKLSLIGWQINAEYGWPSWKGGK